MTELKTLNEEFNGWLTGTGLFAAMPSTVPWKESVNATHLDALYFGARSGNKPSTPIVSLQLHTSSGDLEQSSRETIALYLVSMFGTNWTKLWATLNLDYNPIHNYNMNEEISDNGNTTRTPNLTHTSSNIRTPDLTATETSTETPNTKEERTLTRTPALNKAETGTVGNVSEQNGNGQDNIFGFNSQSAVPSNSVTQTNNGTSTDTFNKQFSESGNETTTEEIDKTGTTQNSKSVSQTGIETTDNTDTETGNEQTVKTNTQTTTKSGNIGVTTTQKMISEEREVWFWNFFNQVFSDIDSIISVKTYM